MIKLDNETVLLPEDEKFPEMPISVNFRIVESSNVDKVGWDRFKNMYVEFKSGATYLYFDVSRQRAVAAAYSPSVGTYINRRIKKKFPTLRIA